MSLQECTYALKANGVVSISAGELTLDDLETCAAFARRTRSRLTISNLEALTSAELDRIADAGGDQVIFADRG